MSQVIVEKKGDVAVLRLSAGPTNALAPRVVAELQHTIKDIKGSAKGLVLAGGTKFFSIGIDLPELLELDRPSLTDYWTAMNQLCLSLYTLPMPTASALTGHAIAGGTILALMTDARYIADGRKLMGLNEIRLGLPVPYIADLALRQLARAQAAEQILFSGQLLPPQEALALGLVNEVLPLEEVEARTVEKVAALAALPGPAFAGIKAIKVEQVKRRFSDTGAAKTEVLLDCWFTPETQELLTEAAKKF